MNRTTCACKDCVACCKRQPGPLISGDMERIAKHLGLDIESVKQLFKASAGSLIGIRGGGIMRIPTITPKQKEDGSCIFLDERDRCRIHPVAPFGCAYFDTHMSRDEGDKRCKYAICQHAKPEYQKLRKELAGGCDETI